MRERSVLITDLDNTLYNWVDYFGPCYRAMVHALSRELECAEDILNDQFREVFAQHGSVEYPFSVQKLAICEPLSPTRVEELVYLATVVFGRTRDKYLRLYDGVDATLRWCQQNNVAVVGASNAPLYLVWRRLSKLGIADAFDGLAAARGYPLEAGDPYVAAYKNSIDPSKKIQTWPMSSEELKPSSMMYKSILLGIAGSWERTWVIGDSLHKDLLPAKELGLHTVWAKYGTTFSDKNLQTLLRITHWSSARVEKTYDLTAFVPEHQISSFAALRDIIEVDQLGLWR